MIQMQTKLDVADNSGAACVSHAVSDALSSEQMQQQPLQQSLEQLQQQQIVVHTPTIECASEKSKRMENGAVVTSPDVITKNATECFFIFHFFYLNSNTP